MDQNLKNPNWQNRSIGPFQTGEIAHIANRVLNTVIAGEVTRRENSGDICIVNRTPRWYYVTDDELFDGPEDANDALRRYRSKVLMAIAAVESPMELLAVMYDNLGTTNPELHRAFRSKMTKMAAATNPETNKDDSGVTKQHACDTNTAYGIAKSHLSRMNPGMWNGLGDRPKDFDTRIVTYSINDEVELDVSFEWDDGQWTHYVELRSKVDDGDRLDGQHGYGVDSVQNLADTIADICKDLLNDI